MQKRREVQTPAPYELAFLLNSKLPGRRGEDHWQETVRRGDLETIGKL